MVRKGESAMNSPEVVIAIYRPKTGMQDKLDELVKKHFPILKDYGLTTDRAPFIGRSEDGSVIEIFEWASVEKAKQAHDHPAVAQIWEAMAMVCDFGKLEQLAEAKNVFPHFRRAFGK
jgi:hypothetical protein